MSDADRLLREGDLAGARAALVEIVRAQPSNEQARMFLFQLLAVCGEWEKARKQLEALATLSPEAQMLSVAYGQAIAAEDVRAKVFSGVERAHIHAEADGWAASLPDAIQAFAKGDFAAGEVARDTAFDAVPDTPGRFNDVAFDWIADADSRFGPAIEAIIGGRYGLVPFSAIERIESEGTKDLRDIVWYPVQIAFKSGQSVAAFLLSRYPGSDAVDDSAIRLGRSTEWREAGFGDAGLGQRVFALSDGDDHGILSLTSLVFD